MGQYVGAEDPGAQLRALDEELVAAGGTHEFIGISHPSTHLRLFLFATSEPTSSFALAQTHMRNKILDAKQAAQGED